MAYLFSNLKHNWHLIDLPNKSFIAPSCIWITLLYTSLQYILFTSIQVYVFVLKYL